MCTHEIELLENFVYYVYEATTMNSWFIYIWLALLDLISSLKTCVCVSIHVYKAYISHYGVVCLRDVFCY